MATNVTDLQKREGGDLAKMGFKDQVKYLLEQNKDAIRSALPKHINPGLSGFLLSRRPCHPLTASEPDLPAGKHRILRLSGELRCQ